MGLVRVDVLNGTIRATTDEPIRRGEPLLLSVRPEDIQVLSHPDAGEQPNVVAGQIIVSTLAGASTHLEVRVADQTLKVSVYGAERFDLVSSAGRDVQLKLNRCAVIRAQGGAH